MKRSGLSLALILSLLLNVGVVGAVGYRAVVEGHVPAILGGEASGVSLPAYLKLGTEQRRQWHDLEIGFLRDLESDWQQIRAHREQMIHGIFSERPDLGHIETERATIAQLQAAQQKRVIEQLLREREILDPAQQRALAELLIRQMPTTTTEGRLHGQ